MLKIFWIKQSKRLPRINCIFTIFLTLCLTLFIAGCQQEKAVVFNVAIPSPLESIDPRKAGDPLSIQILGQTFERLINVDSDGKLSPGLAISWEARDNNQTWVVKLRDKRPLHGGGRLSADQIKNALEQLSLPTSFNAYVLNGILEGAKAFSEKTAKEISGISIVDGNTLRFSLVNPEASFPSRLAHPGIMIYSDSGAEKFSGSGPFEIVEYDGSRLRMSRFHDFPSANKAQPSVLIQTVNFIHSANRQLWYAAVSNGELDLAILSKRELTPEQLKSSDANIVEWSPYNIRFIGMNLERMKSKELRRSIAAILNREEIINQILDGGAEVSAGFAPPSMAGHPISPLASEQVDILRKRVVESGYDGRPLILTVNDRGAANDIGIYTKAQLTKIGVNVQINRVDFQTAITSIVKGETDLYFMNFDYSYNDPSLILDAFKSGNIPIPNFWRYKPVEEISAQIIVAQQTGISNSDFQKLQQGIVDEVPAVFLYTAKQYVVLSNSFTGLELNPVNQFDLSKIEKK